MVAVVAATVGSFRRGAPRDADAEARAEAEVPADAAPLPQPTLDASEDAAIGLDATDDDATDDGVRDEAPAADDASTATVAELLAGQIAPDSRQGSCAEPYRVLAQSFARLAGQPSPGSPREVAAAMRSVTGMLPPHVCRASADGTWALFYDKIDGLLGDATARESSESYPLFRVRATGRLVFLPADEAPRAELSFALGEAPLLSLQTTDDGFSAAAHTVSDLEIGDIDGDDVPELLVTGRNGQMPFIEGGDTRAHLAAVYKWTADGHLAIDPQIPAGVPYDHLVDGDGDGHFDLVSPRPFFGLDEGNLGEVELEGPELLYHSLADGGVSRSDDAARAFAKKSCPARPTGLPKGEASLPIFLTDEGDRAVHDVACARLWGVPEKTVASWVAAANGGKVLTRWATMGVPLQLGP